MRKYLINNFIDLLQTMPKGIRILNSLSVEGAFELLADMQNGIVHIGNLVETEGTADDQKVIPVLEDFAELLYESSTMLEHGPIPPEQLAHMQNECASVIRHIEVLSIQYEILFMPYKASMWDALESVYIAARNDPDCSVTVMPVPYFNLDENGKALSTAYEIDNFPKEIALTSFREYDLKQSQPDVIFIHNPYDACNRVTQLPVDYFSSQLVNVTSHLVYIPYKVCSGTVKDIYCQLPGVQNSWKTFVQSEQVRETYMKYNSPERIVALGSPKIDSVVYNETHRPDIPREWAEVIRGRKIFLLNTHLNNIITFPDLVIDKIKRIFSEFSSASEDAVLLWRPHPLSIETVKSMCPQKLPEYLALVEDFKKMENGIYDDTPDVHRAIAVSDAYIGDSSSLLPMYGVTGKPSMILNIYANPKSLLERSGGSLRASAFCAGEACLYFSHAGNGDLYTYDLQEKTVRYLGCPDEELYKHMKKIYKMFFFQHTLLLLGGTDTAWCAIHNLQTGSTQIVEGLVQSQKILDIAASIQWENRVYMTTRDMSVFGYVDMESGEFVDQRAAFSDCVLPDSLQINDSCIFAHEIAFLCREAHCIIVFDIEAQSVKVIHADANCGNLLKLHYDGSAFTFLTENRELYTYDAPTGIWKKLLCIADSFHADMDITKMFRHKKKVFLLPAAPNPICKIDLEAGTVQELEYPDGFKFDVPPLYSVLPIRFEQKGNRLFLCPTVSNQLLTLDMEKDTLSGEKIGLPIQWKTNEEWELRLTMSYNGKRYNSIYYEVDYGIRRYIEIVTSGQDLKSAWRKEENAHKFSNPQGGVGRMIWNYVKEALQGENKEHI